MLARRCLRLQDIRAQAKTNLGQFRLVDRKVLRVGSEARPKSHWLFWPTIERVSVRVFAEMVVIKVSVVMGGMMRDLATACGASRRGPCTAPAT